jgi:minor extracellular serine protease Vpr
MRIHGRKKIFRINRAARACAAALLSVVVLLNVARVSTAMDLARVENRTDAAVAQFGVSGRGVLIAILDRGIDWRNNDFRNDDGTSRIQYIFDLSDDAGANAANNPYRVGTIYTKAQIDAALAGGTNLATRDAVGHGSTTAGIAAGNGRNLASRKYRGIAPNASLIICKVVSEGAPAHDTEPAETAFFNPDRVSTAIDFVKAKARELNMPVVILMNFGSINGPTDGTSQLSRKIDDTVGPGKPGIVIVNGVGDDGGMPNHAGGNLKTGETASIQIQKTTTGTLRFDGWYRGDDRFDVTIQTPGGTFGPYASPATNDDFDNKQTSQFNYYQLGSNRVFYGAKTTKREIFVDLTGAAGTYTIQLKATRINNDGRFDATINPSNIEGGANNNRFLNFVVPGNIQDIATARRNITPTDYVIRTNYTDIDGIPRSITGQGNIGDLWTGSSTGPTFDGRLGVDIAAPGESVFTVYNPRSYFAQFRFNEIQDGGGFYGRASAVSAAAPQITGIIALMLEKNPQLDADEVKGILQASARRDSFTGQTPNPMWGYGKADAQAAVSLVVNNPINDPTFYVRQHYVDFLNREPDAAGLQFWVNQLASCNGDATCIDIKRQNVSAAYFLSREFQETGFYVIRVQRTAFAKVSNDAQKRITLSQFLTDSSAVGAGFVDGQVGADAVLEQNKNNYAQAIVTSSAFVSKYPQTLTAAQFVDALYQTAGVQAQGTERQDAITAFGAGDTAGRAASLRKVAESASVKNAEFAPAFVLLQYFGYLRRNPTDAPDTSDAGYQFWLSKLNAFGGDYIRSEMVRSFILSSEYRKRFGQP